MAVVGPPALDTAFFQAAKPRGKCHRDESRHPPAQTCSTRLRSQIPTCLEWQLRTLYPGVSTLALPPPGPRTGGAASPRSSAWSMVPGPVLWRDSRTTMLLGSIDSTAARNLCCVCWYSSLCSNAKKDRPFLDSSSRIDKPGEDARSGLQVLLRGACVHRCELPHRGIGSAVSMAPGAW